MRPRAGRQHGPFSPPNRHRTKNLCGNGQGKSSAPGRCNPATERPLDTTIRGRLPPRRNVAATSRGDVAQWPHGTGPRAGAAPGSFQYLVTKQHLSPLGLPSSVPSRRRFRNGAGFEQPVVEPALRRAPTIATGNATCSACNVKAPSGRRPLENPAPDPRTSSAISAVSRSNTAVPMMLAPASLPGSGALDWGRRRRRCSRTGDARRIELAPGGRLMLPSWYTTSRTGASEVVSGRYLAASRPN